MVVSGFARFDVPRLFEGFRRVGGDEVADFAGRGFRGEPTTDAEEAQISAAFGPHVPDEDQESRAQKHPELGEPGMEIVRDAQLLDQLSRIESPTLVCVGELTP